MLTDHGGLQTTSAMSGSCPSLLGDHIDGVSVERNLLNYNKQKCNNNNKPFISNMLMKNNLLNVHVDIIVSSAEAAQDIAAGRSSLLQPLHRSSDMLPRSGRQRSQSLDKLLGTDINILKKETSRISLYRKETGENCNDGDFCSNQKVFAVLENPESETRWYFKYFLGKVHKNYVGNDMEKSPFFLSVVSNGGTDNVHRCILWKKTGNKRMCFQDCQNGKDTSAKAILKKFATPKCERSVKEVSSASLQEDFLTLEEQEGAVKFKFGVLYARAGQETDDEMFSNENGSQRFDQFLHLLGDTIDLMGWTSFKGGLDTKNNATGTASVYTVFEGHEVMFHVSTMLPYSKENRQQVERKRHIGNDIVVIIFIDGNDDEAYSTALNFNPRKIRSHFNHIFALVTYYEARDTYRLVIHSADSVPIFGPELPPNGEFKDHLDFRDFLMAKLINAEKASYSIPTFSLKRERTLAMLLKDVEQKCNSEFRKYLSQISGTSPNASRKYKELEQSFSEVGQKIKVDKIRKGDHPTSHKTTAFKKDPWDTSCIAENFPHKVTCGDICNNGELIVSTQSEGTFIVFPDGSYMQIIDKSLPISQIVVAHRHKLLLLRSGFYKECNYFYVVSLDLFFSTSMTVTNRSLLDSNKLPLTKGCHLFCTTPLSSNYLRVVVAIKSKVVMLLWKHLAEPTSTTCCTPFTPKLESYNLVEGFVKHREFNLTDVPVMMDLIDETPSGKLCVVYQKHSAVEAVDEITGDTQKIYNIDSVKMKVKEMRVVNNYGKNELLIGHNLSCKTVSLMDGMVYSSSPEIMWNAEPKSIVYLPPYILAFTVDTIEIRIISNGSLIQSIDIPDLKLISQKNDLVFSSRSLVLQSSMGAENYSRPGGKAGKLLGKSEHVNSGVHIYRMRSENMLGRKSSSKSFQSFDNKDEDMSSSAGSSQASLNNSADSNSNSLLEMRKTPSSLRIQDGEKSPTKPTRHMLVIPDNCSNKDRIVEVRCRNSSLNFIVDTPVPIACPSPDSGVHDDYHSPPMTLKNGKRLMSYHSRSSSSPSILNCDSTHNILHQ